jgi:hypothetical protein
MDELDQTVTRDWKLSMLYLTARSSKLQQLFVKVRVNEVYLFHVFLTTTTKRKVKPSRYTPWRRLGGEEV